MYDSVSVDYDRFVNWPARLAGELPFIEKQLRAAGARRVLDAACGTGMHAIALAEQGYETVGVDASGGMIEKARSNARSAGVAVDFVQASFGNISLVCGTGFDAILCLGNSIPHVEDMKALADASLDFAEVLRPEGLLLIQNRNFDAVLASGERWMEPQSYVDGDDEWVFLRFYDFESEDVLRFNFLTLHRAAGKVWQQTVASSGLLILLHSDLVECLRETGFSDLSSFGSLHGEGFDQQGSPNLVLAARRS
ncbi:MAG: class I SAM-dependent methyltransferase [Anaerolineae bacterium]|nr:class I SAM-dependent methyltransferase [Anaerolineae bacterium]